MERPLTVLLVDDEESVQKLLSYPLEREGYRVVQARDGEQALERYREERVDLVILDLMLPRLDGLAVCRQLREERSAVPIIMLTARDDEGDKVLGLELGADDYITKPFSIREFMSRVRALLRRARLPALAARDEVIEADGLRIDSARRAVALDGNPVQLTYLEFELLRALAASPGLVFSRKMLLDPGGRVAAPWEPGERSGNSPDRSAANWTAVAWSKKGRRRGSGSASGRPTLNAATSTGTATTSHAAR